MGSIYEKNRGRKSRDTAPLKAKIEEKVPTKFSLLFLYQKPFRSFLEEKKY